MTRPFAAFGIAWSELVDALADSQVDLLRRTHSKMATALDRAAMRDVEGARDWRDVTSKRSGAE